MWEDFVTCCKLSSTEIFAKKLSVRTATVSTNMTFITRILRKGQRILEITVAGDQFGAQLPRSPKGTLIKNDAVTSIMFFTSANRTHAPNMRRERMSQKSMESRVFVDPE